MELIHTLGMPRLSQLTHLELSLELADDILKYLTRRPSSSKSSADIFHFPRLQTLIMDRVRPSSDGLISRMVQSRLSGKPSSELWLMRVDIKAQGKLEFTEDEKVFQTFRQAGVSAKLEIILPSALSIY